MEPERETTDASRRDLSDLELSANIEISLLPFARRHVWPTRFDNERLKYLQLRTGISYLIYPSDDGEEGKSEWRVIGQITPRSHLPLRLLLGFRNRIELRWIDGEFSWRYRPRLSIDREFHLRHFSIVPFGSAEAFWDSRVQDWNRTRYELGAVLPVAHWLATKAYWAYQRNYGSGNDTNTNALGVTVAFYF